MDRSGVVLARIECDTVSMGFHHVAFATKDTAATHHFYTEVMGFELVKVVCAPTPGEHGGFSKHFFYATGIGDATPSGDGGMIAFWELHDDQITGYHDDINAAAGTPWWVNHIAFDAPSRADLDRHRQRWQDHGHTVLEVDHEFCVSIYLRDPSGNTVEFCHTVRPFTADERERALAVLDDPAPALDGAAKVTVWHPTSDASHEPVAGS
jgi:catechol 2,3-dioxygenase-like lactoylglutathione lyase family enzyme